MVPVPTIGGCRFAVGPAMGKGLAVLPTGEVRSPSWRLGGAAVGWVLVVGGIVVAVGAVLVFSYRRVGPRQALLILGYGGTRVVTEGGAFVWPVVHEAWLLPLDPWEVVVPSPSLATADGRG